MTKFTNKIVKAILNLHEVDPIKKGLAVQIVRYLLPLRKKEIVFSIKDLVGFTSLNKDFLNQPYDTFQNPKGFIEAIKFFTEIKEDGFDENKYLSLLESTLMMMMAYNLRWGTSTEDDFGLRTRIYGYPVFQRLSIKVLKDDFFASSFEIEFSNDLWTDYTNFVSKR